LIDLFITNDRILELYCSVDDPVIFIETFVTCLLQLKKRTPALHMLW